MATENEPTGKDRKVSSMKKYTAILAFPSVSAVYAMYGGKGRDTSRDHSWHLLATKSSWGVRLAQPIALCRKSTQGKSRP
jgi:hypothetical protein